MLIKDNKLKFVEVKIERDGVSKEQIVILNLLCNLGFECSIEYFYKD